MIAESDSLYLLLHDKLNYCVSYIAENDPRTMTRVEVALVEFLAAIRGTWKCLDSCVHCYTISGMVSAHIEFCIVRDAKKLGESMRARAGFFDQVLPAAFKIAHQQTRAQYQAEGIATLREEMR
jgi:hypothetical protein